MSNALICIKPNHVVNILSGKKTVELRTRNLLLPIGTKLWIYSTLPKGKVEAIVEIDFLDTRPPNLIWRDYKNSMSISKKLFNEYTKCRENVTAIGLRNVQLSHKNLSLNSLRSFDKNFMPPQFFMKITPDKKIYPAFT